MLRKLTNIGRVRPSPAVYALVVVADYEHVAVFILQEVLQACIVFCSYPEIRLLNILEFS